MAKKKQAYKSLGQIFWESSDEAETLLRGDGFKTTPYSEIDFITIEALDAGANAVVQEWLRRKLAAGYILTFPDRSEETKRNLELLRLAQEVCKEQHSVLAPHALLKDLEQRRKALDDGYAKLLNSKIALEKELHNRMQELQELRGQFNAACGAQTVIKGTEQPK